MLIYFINILFNLPYLYLIYFVSTLPLNTNLVDISNLLVVRKPNNKLGLWKVGFIGSVKPLFLKCKVSF